MDDGGLRHRPLRRLGLGITAVLVAIGGVVAVTWQDEPVTTAPTAVDRLRPSRRH